MGATGSRRPRAPRSVAAYDYRNASPSADARAAPCPAARHRQPPDGGCRSAYAPKSPAAALPPSRSGRKTEDGPPRAPSPHRSRSARDPGAARESLPLLAADTGSPLAAPWNDRRQALPATPRDGPHAPQTLQSAAASHDGSNLCASQTASGSRNTPPDPHPRKTASTSCRSGWRPQAASKACSQEPRIANLGFMALRQVRRPM